MSVQKCIIPTVEFLRECLDFDLDSGVLFWRERPTWTFTNTAEQHLERTAKAWNARRSGAPAFHRLTRFGYRHGYLNGVGFFAHRILWKLATGFEPFEIDHINGARSDNRRTNLRDVTSKQNRRNVTLYSNNVSGVVGVRWDQHRQQWHASIQLDGRRPHLGYFETKEEAVLARKRAETLAGYHANHGKIRA